MIDILQKNKEIIKKTNGNDFFNTFSKSNDKFYTEKTYSEFDTLYFKNNDEKIYVHSKYDPVTIAQKFIHGIDPNKKNRFFLFGLGLGYEFIEITKIEKIEEIIVIEKNKDIIFNFLKTIDLTQINKNIRILRNTEEIYEYFITLSVDQIDHMIEYFNSGYEIYDNNFFNAVKDIYVNINRESVTNKNSVNRYYKQWFDCSVKNFMPFLNSDKMDDFYTINKGKAAIVVGAGPSLDKQMELLKKVYNENSMFIFSTHTVFQKLLDFGIKPHAVCAVDAIQPIPEGYKKDGFTTSLFTSYHVNPEIFKYAKGNIFFMPNDTDGFSDLILRKLKKNVKEVSTGGSVACTMTGLLDVAGFSQIIYIGMDLAYTNDLTHASGTHFAGKTKFNFDRANGRLMVDAYDGDTIETSITMNGYIKWIEKYIVIKNPNIINATEGGALIKGTTQMAFSDAIEKYKSKEINLIDKGVNLFTDNEKLQTYEILKKYRDDLQKIHDYPSIEKFDDECMSIIGLMRDKVIYEVNEIDNSNKEKDKIYIKKMVEAIEYALEGYDRLLEDIKNGTRNIQ